MFISLRHGSAEGCIARLIAFALFGVGRWRPKAVFLLDILHFVKADLAPVFVIFRNGGEPRCSRAEDQPLDLADVAPKFRRARRRQWRRLLSVCCEQEIRMQLRRHVDRLIKARGYMTVTLPGHTPIERIDGFIDRLEGGTGIDRLEQKKRPPFGEDGEGDTRGAR